MRQSLVALFVAVVLAACGKSHVDEAPSRVPVIPDSITSQLGTVGFAMAVDLDKIDIAALTVLIPDDPPCIHAVLKTVKVAVLTQSAESWQAYVTGLGQPLLRDCVSKFAPMFGGTVADHGSGFELALGDKPAVFTWTGDTALITEGSNAPHAGDPPAVILELLAKVPRTAKGWLVASGFPKYKIKSATAWMETDPTTGWTFTVIAEASEQDMAKPWLDSIVTGFTAAARAKGATIDPSWFTVTGTPTTAKLVATLPPSAFQVSATK
ncbi:MAG: hypothetical protein ABI591_24270 [Kofleriaceae bacterium]